MTRRTTIANKLPSVLLWGAILAVLYATSLYSYLLFHVAVEVFIVVVAFSVFVMVYNTRRFDNSALLNVLGAGFFSVAMLDFFHTLAYKGMGIFTGYDANLPTQLWVALRYVHSLTMLAALLLMGKQVRFRWLMAISGGISLLLLVAIFSRVFPTAYIEGVGLTPFKIISEYAVAAIYLCVIGLLFAKKQQFDPKVFQLLVAASAGAIVTGMFFTLYFSVYDVFNKLGHYLNLISFYLVYKAVLDTGLRRPYALLFRELKQSEESLRRSEGLLRSVFGNASVILMATDRQGVITLLDGKELPDLGIRPKDAIGRPVDEVAHLPVSCEDVQRALAGETFAIEKPLGEGTVFYSSFSPLRDGAGQVIGMIAVATDITERRQAEEMSRRVAQAARVREAEEAERRRLARELHDQVGGNLGALSMSVGVVKALLPQMLKHANPEEALEILSAQLDSSLELVQQTSQSIRSVMADLRPAVLDEFGLAAALRWYGERLAARTELIVQVEGDDLQPRPEASVETELFRITQEALSNVVKHASASRVTISLTHEDGMLSLVIADDGVGFDPAQLPEATEHGGWGLGTMVERAEAAGGHLTVESQPGKGTQLSVRLPWPAHQDARHSLIERAAAS